MLSIPSDKGTYAIQILLPKAKTITIGKLGRYKFPFGAYVYVGSAFGSGGLRSRINRHIYGSGNIHWHIDTLLKYAKVRAFFYLIDIKKYECKWAQALTEVTGTTYPVPGFGSSDCTRCHAHLISFTHSGISENMGMHNERLFKTIRETFTKISDLPPDSIKGFQIPEARVSRFSQRRELTGTDDPYLENKRIP